MIVDKHITQEEVDAVFALLDRGLTFREMILECQRWHIVCAAFHVENSHPRVYKSMGTVPSHLNPAWKSNRLACACKWLRDVV